MNTQSEAECIVVAVLADTGINWQTAGYMRAAFGPFRVVGNPDDSMRAKVLASKGVEVMGGWRHRCEHFCELLNIEYARCLMTRNVP